MLRILLFLGLGLVCYGWGFVPLADAAPPHAIHTVRSGETLYSISHHYDISTHALIHANGLSKGAHLRVGQHLVIPLRKGALERAHPPSPTSASVHPHSKPASVPTLDSDQEAPAPAAPHYLFIVGKIRKQIDSAKIEPGRWRYIVFHHSGTPSGNAKAFDYYHRYVRGMENGLAYHFVIGNGNGSGDGEIEIGNRWLQQLQGGHLHSDALNQIAIGVCFVGDFDRTQPSKKQIAAAIELVSYLRQRCGPPALIFKAHREINPRPTECPGKLFPVAAFHKLFDNP